MRDEWGASFPLIAQFGLARFAPDAGRYELRQPLAGAGGVALPADIQKLLGWSDADARTAGAFPVRR